MAKLFTVQTRKQGERKWIDVTGHDDLDEAIIAATRNEQHDTGSVDKPRIWARVIQTSTGRVIWK